MQYLGSQQLLDLLNHLLLNQTTKSELIGHSGVWRHWAQSSDVLAGRSLQAAHTSHQYFAISVGERINKALGRERKEHGNEQSHPKVEQKTSTCPSCGNCPEPINKDGSVSMSMTAVDSMVLFPSAIILHYSELAGLSSGIILIPFMSWEFWRWASTAARYKLEHNICCTEPQKLYRITERESKLEWKLLTSNCY